MANRDSTTHADVEGIGEPPKTKFRVLKKKNLPAKTTPWKDIQEFLPVDFLLLTVKDCEHLSCLSFLKSIVRSYEITLGFVYFGYSRNKDSSKEPNSPKFAVIQCSMGATGPGGSLVVVQSAVPVLRPKAVICVGYCGSLCMTKAKLGDVVISSKLITYAYTKKRKCGIEERGSVVPPNKYMAGLIKGAGAGWKAPLKNEKDLEVAVRSDGVFLSGPEVIDDPKSQKELKMRFPQGTAIEMEGEGLYTAAHKHGIEWLVIKGVSDFADGSKSSTDSWRPFASVMAASVVFHMLNDTYVFEDWAHYEDPSKRKRRSSTTDDDTRAKVTRVTVKAGRPSDEELEELSLEIPVKWKKLGGRLGFKNAEITAFHKNNEELGEKAYAMLLAWKRKEASDATYRVLYDALCHKLVQCKSLAQRFCCE